MVQLSRASRVFSCFFVTTFVVGAILVLPGGRKFEVQAQFPIVSILPSSVQIRPEQTVAVDVNITGVTDLWTYEFQVLYPNSVVTCSEIELPSEHFLKPVINPNDYYVIFWEKNEPYNATHQNIHVAYTLLAPEHGVSGSGTLFRINFTGLAIGSAPLVFIRSIMTNSASNYIPHTANNGLITVRNLPYFESLTRDAPFPEYDDRVNVTCQIDGLAQEEIVNVVLLHSYGDSSNLTATMTPLGGRFYAAAIPEYPYNTTVRYRVQVLDNYSQWTTSQEYGYTVVDKTPPQIAIPTTLSTRIMTVNVTEPGNSSGISNVYLSLRDSHDGWWRTVMVLNETGQWTARLTIAVSFTNLSMEYMIQADDYAGNSAILSGNVPLQSWWFADVNSDGRVNILDIVAVAIHLGESS